MNSATWRFVILMGLGLLVGCNSSTETPNTPATGSADKTGDALQAAPAVDPDDVAAITALETVATSLKRDGDGFVTEVNFRGTMIDDAPLQHLLGLQRLGSVLLNETSITDDGLATLGKINTLRNLDLRGCQLSNAGIEHLGGLTNLRALRLSGESGATTVDDAGMATVAKMTSLKALFLDFLWISEEGLALLQNNKQLEELYLAKTLVGDEALALLNQFPKLKKLRISQNQITDDGLAPLAKVPHLEMLDLSENSQVFDGGLMHLSKMTQLKNLNLWRVAITDVGVKHLADLTNMESLNLDNTQLTDEGMPALVGMKKLTFLHLGSTAITDAGLVHLEGLQALKDLKLTRTAVTAEASEQLGKKLTNTKIQLKYLEGE